VRYTGIGNPTNPERREMAYTKGAASRDKSKTHVCPECFGQTVERTKRDGNGMIRPIHYIAISHTANCQTGKEAFNLVHRNPKGKHNGCQECR
jgi:hypothetical protein